MKTSFCENPFWTELRWDDEPPELSKCFQNTIIPLVPAAYVALGGAFYIYHLSGETLRHLSVTYVYCARLILAAFLVILHLINVIVVLGWHPSAELSDLLAGALRLISSCVPIVILICDRRRGVCSSWFLTVFWILMEISETVLWYHQLIKFDALPGASGHVAFSVTTIAYLVLTCQLLLSAVSEQSVQIRFGKGGRNPFYTSSPLSRAYFSYFTEFLLSGFRHTFEIPKLPPPLDSIQSDRCFRRWEKTISKHKPRHLGLLQSLIRCFYMDIAFTWILSAGFIITRITTFVILNELIVFFTDPGQVSWKGYVYCFSIFVVQLMSSLMLRWAYFFALNLGLKYKAILTSAIVRKSLRISTTSLGKYSVGELVNLLSVDADKICTFSINICYVVSCPLHVILALALTWNFLGLSCLAGVAVIVLMTPLTALVAGYCRSVQVKQMDLKDTRLKYVNEILTSMKIIKFYGWEPPFLQRARDVRFQEFKLLRTFAYLTATLRLFWSVSPFLVSLFAFIAYLWANDVTVIRTNVAIVSLCLFNSLRFSLSMIPDTISNAIQTLVSLRRIAVFLDAPERIENLVGRLPGPGIAVRWQNALLGWTENEVHNVVLKNINLTVRTGELVAIVGEIGSGKSSLLSSMLGDVHLHQGKLDLRGSIAYVPQQAWIQNANIKQNIIFSSEFDRPHYKKVLDSCCLTADLKILPAGERTEIGEKGVNLSGGQKQRISLARAVYQNNDIYLLDDPLSAVDAHVGSAIFANVIGNNGLLKGKTRLFVTNMLSILTEVDRIVVLKNGEIVEQGTFLDLKNSGGEFADFLSEYVVEKTTDKSKSEDQKPSVQRDRVQSQLSVDSVHEGDKLISDEVMQSGHVKFAVYKRLFSKMGLKLSLVTLIGFVTSRAFDVLSGLWLSTWSNEPGGNSDEDYAKRTRNILIYALLGLLFGALSFVGSAALANGTVTAAWKLHDLMLNSVTRAPMSFFDSTPLGRLLNRFGKDVDQLDTQLPLAANLFLDMLFQVIAVIILICVRVPLFIVVVVPLLVVYIVVQQIYIRSMRQLKRMEAVTRSPAYNHFAETLSGLSSIRAYGTEEATVKTSDSKVDITHNCTYLLYICREWLETRLDFITNLIVLGSNIMIVSQREDIAPGVAGFMVAYLLGASLSFNFIVYYFSEVEAAVVSSERIDEYTDVTPEAPWKTNVEPEEEWPSLGSVEFEEYSTTYRADLEPVLRCISLSIGPGEKIGVVGRTGAGKSSLTLSLFRILEATTGKLCIDEVDISQLGLHDLRPRLTIIPQDPVIFSGTLRVNLDPNAKHSDEELWNALETAHIKQQFISTGMNTEIAEGGSNLSVGQRQLICLARAVLQKKKVLIMDEATAAVDVETDALIQSTIRYYFNDCTIITIAHRLNTIMDSDRVIVMDFGKIIEQGPPEELLKNPKSRFFDMAREAGLVKAGVQQDTL